MLRPPETEAANQGSPTRFMTELPRPHTASYPKIALITLASAMLLLAWDASGLDLYLASLAGTPAGFPWQDHWFWKGVMHERVRQIYWLPELALIVAIFFPFGPVRAVPVHRRIQLAAGTLVALLLVSSIKLHSHTSCPWDLQEFGGLARYVSHWSGALDGGSGSCFPAGHASAGFAYIGGFFVFRRILPGVARRWLLACLIAGLALGLAQQLRGAHFMSHTLWTAWLCWLSAWMIDLLVTRAASRMPPRAQEPALGLAVLAPETPPV